ncbi:hypothetical protein V5F77_15020 [Xanthobacter sp. DSM 24535]|uniref:hypothetical protein n=1 Tax=Roseixanthobacter psychrophilus TaxID=3119917 RepID=UPI00372B2764
MKSKWLQRLLARKQGLEAGEDLPLKTFETPPQEVLKVLRVPDQAAPANSDTFHAVPPGELSEIPAAYLAAREQMQTEVPVGISTLHWDQALADADRFLARWGSCAGHLGWSVVDIFEVPGNWIGGLVWELCGGEVIALTRREATIECEGLRASFCIPPSSLSPIPTPLPTPLRRSPSQPPWRRARATTRVDLHPIEGERS